MEAEKAAAVRFLFYLFVCLSVCLFVCLFVFLGLHGFFERI